MPTDSTFVQALTWVVGTVNTVLAATSIGLVTWIIRRLTAEQADQWSAIEKLRDGVEECESRENADRRSDAMWQGIDKIRSAVAELGTIAAGQYVRRDEFKTELRSLKEDLMVANRQEIELLKQLIRKTN